MEELQTSENAARFELMPIEALYESPLNPRQSFDQAKLQELADSIAKVGILTPLLVRPGAAFRETPGDSYEIAAGHRRYRAAKIAGLTAVPAIVREMTDVEFLLVLTVENLQRDDLHPLEEADGYRALMEHAGYDVGQVAAKVGKSVSYVYQRLKLGDLAPAVRKLFIDGTLTAGHAILLARLQPKDQERALHNCVEQEWIIDDGSPGGKNVLRPSSVRALGAHIARNIHLRLDKAPWQLDDASLLPAAGACATCPKRTGFIPELYPDVERDTCTDRACYKAKEKAFLDQARAELRAAGSFIEVSDSRWSSVRSLITRDRWKEASKKKPCASAKSALIVEGERLGKIVLACTDFKCKSHWDKSKADHGGSNSRDDAEEKFAERVAEAWCKAITAANAATLDRIVKSTSSPNPSNAAVLRHVARGYFQEMQQDTQRVLFRLHSWEPVKTKTKWKSTLRDFKTAIDAQLENMTGLDVMRLLVEMSLVGLIEVKRHSYGLGRGPDHFAAAVKHLGVDPAVVETPQVKDASGKKVPAPRVCLNCLTKLKAKDSGFFCARCKKDEDEDDGIDEPANEDGNEAHQEASE